MGNRTLWACAALLALLTSATPSQEQVRGIGEVAAAFHQDNDGGWQNRVDMTDRWYTHGVALSVAHTWAPRGEVGDYRRRIGSPAPARTPGPSVMVYTARHAMYTPQDLAASIPPLDDRQYAGVASITASGFRSRESVRDLVAVSVGAVGPAVAAGEIQRFAHVQGGVVEPRGWDTQIANRPLIQFSASRAWNLSNSRRPTAQQTMAHRSGRSEPARLIAALQPELGGSVGTISATVRAATEATIGLALGDADIPQSWSRIRSLANLLAGDRGTRPGLAIALSGGAAVRAVAYDILVSGDQTAGQRQVRPLVGEAWGAVSLSVNLERWWAAARYDQRWIGPEFESQGSVHRFASVMFAVGLRR